MITLESIVESIKHQLKPYLNDDTRLYDEFIIRMIDDTRATLIKAVQVSNESLTPYYQDYVPTLAAWRNGDDEYMYSEFALPSRLMSNVGRKNIQNINVDNLIFSSLDFHYCTYEEFMAYSNHVYGKDAVRICNYGDKVLLYHEKFEDGPDILFRGIFETPSVLPDYDYKTSSYPVSASILRQLEIVTFQHIAVKLGMPADVVNNGYDETKNAQVPQQKQQRQSNQEGE